MVLDDALERAVGLEFGRAVSGHFNLFIMTAPGEVDARRFGAARLPDLSHAAAEGEVTAALFIEQDVPDDASHPDLKGS